MAEIIPESLMDEATSWFVRLRDDALTAAERVQFATWLAQDPRHASAMAAVEQLWTKLDAAGLCSPIPLRIAEFPRRARNSGRRAALIGGALAACIAVAVAWSVDFASAFADYRSPIGERRQVVLRDGSVAELNTGAALSVQFTPERRVVTLHKGEAHFTVQPDAARPFVVMAGGGTATAVGTAFNVKIAASQADVAVTQGVVDVRAGAGEAVRLKRGEMISYGDSGPGAVVNIEPADVTAWQRDRLVFRDAPLGQVVGDLARYRAGRVIVMDDSVARLPVTGVFDTRRTGAAFDTMARTLPIRLVHVSDLLILVYPARPE